jgi:hypothetical protein
MFVRAGLCYRVVQILSLIMAGSPACASRPSDSRFITPETTPPSIPTNPRRDPIADGHSTYRGRLSGGHVIKCGVPRRATVSSTIQA